MVVYALIDPVTYLIRYIGKTSVNINVRVQQHVSPKQLTARTHKACWLKSLIEQNLAPIVVIIETVKTKNALNQAEMFWIAYWNCMGAPLTNNTPGGDGLPHGYKPSIKTREKLSLAGRGRPVSAAHRKALSAARKGQKPSHATRLKLKTAHTGQTLREETRQKMRTIRNKQGPRVIDENGVTYATVQEAAARLSVSRTSLWKALNGKPAYVAGHSVRYL